MLRKPRRAFTLIELLVVLTIIAILIIALLPGYGMLQGRARLQNVSDTIGQVIEQAKTLSTSGYMTEVNEEDSEAVGVYMESGKNEIVLFSCPLATLRNASKIYTADSHIISTYEGGDIYIRHLRSSADLPNIVILFSPPFGSSQVVVNEFPAVTYLSMEIEVGLGTEENDIKKIIQFDSLTNHISYE